MDELARSGDLLDQVEIHRVGRQHLQPALAAVNRISVVQAVLALVRLRPRRSVGPAIWA
jgi:hypothetical protein